MVVAARLSIARRAGDGVPVSDALLPIRLSGGIVVVMSGSLGGDRHSCFRRECNPRVARASKSLQSPPTTMADTVVAQQEIDQHTEEFLEQAAGSKFDFHSISTKAAGDEKLKTAINNAVLRQYTGRQLQLLQLPDSDALRTLAGQIKQHALDYLDYYLDQLKAN